MLPSGRRRRWHGARNGARTYGARDRFDPARLERMERRLQVLEDAEAIRNLKARYAALCDNRYDAEGIASLSTEDAVWESPRLGPVRRARGDPVFLPGSVGYLASGRCRARGRSGSLTARRCGTSSAVARMCSIRARAPSSPAKTHAIVPAGAICRGAPPVACGLDGERRGSAGAGAARDAGAGRI
jgi:hypothetical protein